MFKTAYTIFQECKAAGVNLFPEEDSSKVVLVVDKVLSICAPDMECTNVFTRHCMHYENKCT